MGRSSATSCLKLIACGSHDSVDRDDLQAPERKDSSDRSGWSFRKRSARHRVLSNSVTSETPSGNKASSDTPSVSFQTPPSSTIQEKSSVLEWTEEKTELCSPVDSKFSEIITEDVKTVDMTPDESVVIIIQAAIRGFLVRRVILKHKNIIKLQAAVRGHIVRRQAVGSLRCVQAIVKMQALVRGRRTRLLLEESRTGRVDNGKANEDLGTKPHVTYTSIEKLLSNRFARQLLESKPRTKTINIKCDPAKSDSAWKWLERWMSVTSMGTEQSPAPESAPEQQDEKKLEKSDYELGNEILHEDSCKSEIKSSAEALSVPSEGDENVITCDADGFDSHACGPTLSLSHSTGQPCSQNIGVANSSDNALSSLPDTAQESYLVSKTEPDSFGDQSEMEHEQHVHSLKRPAPEEPETEGKKFLFGSRKASNPAFIAAQSKFEELSSSATSAISVGSSNQEASVDTSSGAACVVTERARETVPAESSFSHTSGVEVGGSECGTELSISSTLDSPDRPEFGVVSIGKETQSLEDRTDHHESNLNSNVDTEVESQTAERDLSDSASVDQERHDCITTVHHEHDNASEAVESLLAVEKQDTIETVVQMQLESEISNQVNKSSPEASPRSHITVPESQETPSSQVSVKPKKSSSGKSGSNHKRRSESSGKGYPSDPNHDYGAKNSLEQLPKDHKSGKRRSSFGSARSDHGDHEARDNSSNNSLPSYMQATESARAKALANSSPRSSPDVQDKEFYIKKRHSLPGTNGRQGSPHVQRSLSQAQQGAKGNGIHSPQERKWRR